ncbi:MAG: hypothetical protein AB7J13_09830 [Pyrinomonadaceae bacterium]
MGRSLLILIAVIAVTSFFSGPAAGQFPIKIQIPKIPKKESPAPTPNPDPVSPTSSATSVSSSPAPAGEVRGKPIPGAKITFSNNPDGSSPKTSFASSEFIYGRLDLGGKTVYDAFGLKNQTDVPIYYINYDLKIYKPGEKPYAGNWGGAFNNTLVSKEDAKNTYWTFDVLPDPTKISTLKSMLAYDKDFERKAVAGIYSKWHNADSARSTFPQSGTYIIDVTIWGDAYDDWGKSTGDFNMRPTASAQFTFQFSGTDGQTLVANAEKAGKTLESAKIASEMHRKMPDWWFKGATYPAEPRLATARLVPMIKGFIAQWNLTYMKHMIVKTDGPLWTIKKNDLGIPTFKDLSPYIYIIYKDPKESLCNIGAVYMRQPYAGAGTYGEPFLGGIRDVEYIDCSVVK